MGKALILLVFVLAQAGARELTFRLVDKHDQPLPGAAFYFLSPTAKDKLSAAADSGFKMDQVNQQFKPHLLIVPTGAKVHFPNSDSIKHHVFSFSPAKTFEIKLYKGRPPSPLTFEQAGIAELGCNIHDWMLGYILVVDTPYFAISDAQGSVSLDLPEGNHSMYLWHPRMRVPPKVALAKGGWSAFDQKTFSYDGELLPALEQYEDIDESEHYE